MSDPMEWKGCTADEVDEIIINTIGNGWIVSIERFSSRDKPIARDQFFFENLNQALTFIENKIND